MPVWSFCWSGTAPSTRARRHLRLSRDPGAEVTEERAPGSAAAGADRHPVPSAPQGATMTVTDEFAAQQRRVREVLQQGDLPMPPARPWPSSPAWTPASTSTPCSGCRRAGPRHPQRRRRGHRGRDPVSGHLPAPARHPEMILVHHTDCGMLTFTDDQVKADIEAATGCAHFARGLLRPGARHPPVDRPIRPARSSSTRTPSAASSTTSPPASSRRSPEHPARLRRHGGAAARRRRPARRRRRGRARRTRSRASAAGSGRTAVTATPAGTGRYG